jgi:hypothetical protein
VTGTVPLEVRIVQEYAQMGTLRQAIDRGLLTVDRTVCTTLHQTAGIIDGIAQREVLRATAERVAA